MRRKTRRSLASSRSNRGGKGWLVYDNLLAHNWKYGRVRAKFSFVYMINSNTGLFCCRQNGQEVIRRVTYA